jgi:hypothetical protein
MQNLARHADDPNTPFWEMLKTGSDAFLATGRAKMSQQARPVLVTQWGHELAASDFSTPIPSTALIYYTFWRASRDKSANTYVIVIPF